MDLVAFLGLVLLILSPQLKLSLLDILSINPLQSRAAVKDEEHTNNKHIDHDDLYYRLICKLHSFGSV